VSGAVEVDRAIREAQPGQQLPIVFERRGVRVSGVLRLVEDPAVEVVPAENAGQSVSPEQRRFRDAWLTGR
jgi:hypothetical protein